ncbi:MAG: alpha-amylase family protein [Planctomycetota bacterium]|jgi:hypothetical protein
MKDAAELLITDLTCALPRSAWTDADANIFQPIAERPAGGWRILDYRTDHYDGRMLQSTDPESAVLTISLNREGWHAISIGMVERSWGMAAIELRLTGEEHWDVLWAVDGPMHEAPWRFADLTGRALEVRYPQDLRALPAPDHQQRTVSARLTSVRCKPVAEEHLALVQTHRHHPLVYTNDGHGIFFLAQEPGAHIVADAIGRFAESDFDTCCFCPGGADLVNYPSRVGYRFCQDGWDFPRAGDHNHKAMVEGTIEMGVDSLQVAIDTGHAQQHTVLEYIRPQAWVADPDLDHMARSPFFCQHPEWRCIEADGTPDAMLSIAFPEVRAHLAEIFAEALDRGADGICLVFVRGFPVARYEEPVCERYRQAHGNDPSGLGDTDPSLQAIWSDLTTEWLVEIRAQLDAAGPSAMCQRRQLTVMTGAHAAWNNRFGFDIGRWAREGLIDAVLPYPKPFEQEGGYIDVAEHARLLAGTGVKLLPGLGSYTEHEIPLHRIRQRAHDWYSQGADGLPRWDAFGCLARLRLDDPVLQRLWCEDYMGFTEIEMTEIAGLSLRHFGPRLAL